MCEYFWGFFWVVELDYILSGVADFRLEFLFWILFGFRRWFFIGRSVIVSRNVSNIY